MPWDAGKICSIEHCLTSLAPELAEHLQVSLCLVKQAALGSLTMQHP